MFCLFTVSIPKNIPATPSTPSRLTKRTMQLPQKPNEMPTQKGRKSIRGKQPGQSPSKNTIPLQINSSPKSVSGADPIKPTKRGAKPGVKVCSDTSTKILLHFINVVHQTQSMCYKYIVKDKRCSRHSYVFAIFVHDVQ